MRQRKKNKGSISGKRFATAREIKMLTWQDLADAFTEKATREASNRKVSFEVSAIQKWANRGIPGKWLFFVAEYFKVNEWVFTDETLPDDDFKKIISDPTLMDKFRQAREVPSFPTESEASLQQPSHEVKTLPKLTLDNLSKTEQSLKSPIIKDIAMENTNLLVSERKSRKDQKADGSIFPKETYKKDPQLSADDELLKELIKLIDKNAINQDLQNVYKYWNLIQSLPEVENRLIIFRRLVDHFPNDFLFLRHLVNYYLRLGQVPQAIEAMDHAIKIAQPDSVKTIIYQDMGSFFRSIISDLIKRINNHNDLTPGKMDEIKDFVVHANDHFQKYRKENIVGENEYTKHIDLLIYVIDFGYRISGKRKYSRFLNDPSSEWYFDLLKLAINIFSDLKRLRGGKKNTKDINKLHEKLCSFELN